MNGLSYAAFIIDFYRESSKPLSRLFWWEDASHDAPLRIAAQVMVLGNLEDIQSVLSLGRGSRF